MTAALAASRSISVMNVCTSFDGTQIGDCDEGQGPPVILLHEKVVGFLEEIQTALRPM